MKRKAIIDLGTNTFHLLIVDVGVDTFEVLVKEKRPVKIGEGGISNGIITSKAIERAIKALSEFKSLIDQFDVSHISCFATSAFRNASNNEEVVKEIKGKTSIEVQIISGDKEAELIYKGVLRAVELSEETAIIMDIGGGSVEYIICNKDEIFWKQSFEIGGQRLMDLFHHNHKDAITPADVVRLDEYLKEKLAPLTAAIEKYAPNLLIGASGTFDTLCDMYSLENHLGISIDNEKSFHFPIAFFHQKYEAIKLMDHIERLNIPGMIELRVDMIVVAMGLIDFVLKNYPIQEIKVSNYALKEGVIFD